MELQKSFDTPKIVRIENVVDETPTVKTLFFNDEVLAKVFPGQFIMVWVPGVDEIPMSVMISNQSGQAAITVRKHGEATTALFSKKIGDQIGVRGPYGKSFTIKQGNLLLVGGGTGLVPLVRLLTFLSKTDSVTIMVGAKTKNEVFFEELAKKLLEGTNHNVIVVTEDGTYGHKGLVTEVMEKLMQENKYDAVYTCGPEKMMHKVVQIAVSHDTYVEASVERMMKCGIGICGSCCFGELLSCKDGTVFEGKTLLSNKEFGYTHRNKSGVIENY